jgi:hypothetical protein
MQRVGRCDQCLLGCGPAGIRRFAQHGGADLFISEAGCGGEGRDMDAPFIFASGARAGAVDDDFALAQAQRAAVEQAAGAEFLPGARAHGDGAEQEQWRRATHDAVELLLDFRRVWRIERRKA